jgi:putative membrane protein
MMSQMMGGYGYNWWPDILLIVLVMVLSLFLLTILISALAHWLQRPPRVQTTLPSIEYAPEGTLHGRSATAVLRERYARGEIDLATFAEMVTRLEASRWPASGHQPLSAGGLHPAVKDESSS